jgi:hypothetical protein
LFAPYLKVVNCTGSPPSIDKIKICDFSSTYRVKASCFPSGSMQVLWRLLGKSSIVKGLKCLTLKCYISGYDMYNRVHSFDLVQWRLK